MDLTSGRAALESLRGRGVNGELVDRAECMLVKDHGVEVDWAVMDALLHDEEKWESRAAGILIAAEEMRSRGKMEKGVVDLLEEAAAANLEDPEPRLRECVVKLIEQLAALDGPRTWARFGPMLCEIVDKSFDLGSEDRIVNYAVIHETIGWKALETSMRGLESLIRGYGEQGFFRDGHLNWNDGFILNLISTRSLEHENRFVREVGFDLCSVVIEVILKDSGGLHDSTTDALAEAIARGLSDNWSQVRYGASVAARKLMTGLRKEERAVYCALMVPRMCLNRYYLAMGVRLYSQETWELVFGGEGVQIVSNYIASVVTYYCEQSRADNHGVREAACHSIAELSHKIERQFLSDHVRDLLEALLECFRDDSWPVRDAACVATGRFVLNFGQEAKPHLDDLFKLWITHLSDNIWSVREDSAVALGNALRAFPEEGRPLILDELDLHLRKAFEPDGKDVGDKHDDDHDEEENLESIDGDGERLADDEFNLPVRPSSPRVMAGASSQPVSIVTGSFAKLREKQVRLSTDLRHTDQQLYSCGSLAPKLKRRGVGCMDHGYSRPKKNWEMTDGGIYLLRELVDIDSETASMFMDRLPGLLRTKFDSLHVTILKQLIPISKSFGKRPFKRHLDELLPPCIDKLTSENQLVNAAAADLILHLQQFLGQNVFRGRVEMLMNGERLWKLIELSPYIHQT